MHGLAIGIIAWLSSDRAGIRRLSIGLGAAERVVDFMSDTSMASALRLTAAQPRASRGAVSFGVAPGRRVPIPTDQAFGLARIRERVAPRRGIEPLFST